MGVPDKITLRLTFKPFRAWNVCDSGNLINAPCRLHTRNHNRTRVLQSVAFVTKQQSNRAVCKVGGQCSQRFVGNDHDWKICSVSVHKVVCRSAITRLGDVAPGGSFPTVNTFSHLILTALAVDSQGSDGVLAKPFN